MRLFIGSTFYTSFIIKKAPGTISSFAVFILFLPIDSIPIEYKLIFLVLLGIGHYFCFPYFREKYSNEDPSLYTLDEAFAMVLLNIFFFTTGEWTAAFILFRFFDILKPFWIKNLENSMQLPAIIRNIADDVLAALYTSLLIGGYKYAF